MPYGTRTSFRSVRDGIWEPLGDDCLRETLGAARGASQWVELMDHQVKARAKDQE